jgi:hypothetical protein
MTGTSWLAHSHMMEGGSLVSCLEGAGAAGNEPNRWTEQAGLGCISAVRHTCVRHHHGWPYLPIRYGDKRRSGGREVQEPSPKSTLMEGLRKGVLSVSSVMKFSVKAVVGVLIFASMPQRAIAQTSGCEPGVTSADTMQLFDYARFTVSARNPGTARVRAAVGLSTMDTTKVVLTTDARVCPLPSRESMCGRAHPAGCDESIW